MFRTVLLTLEVVSENLLDTILSEKEPVATCTSSSSVVTNMFASYSAINLFFSLIN